MLDERSPFDAHREGSPIGATPAALAWLKTMELAMMPIKRCKAQEPSIIRSCASSDSTIGQHPGIDRMGFPNLGQLLTTFLEAQLIAQGFRLIPLHDLERR